jgi:hypothetical protein
MLERVGLRPHALVHAIFFLPARVAPGAMMGFRHRESPDSFHNHKRQSRKKLITPRICTWLTNNRGVATAIATAKK